VIQATPWGQKPPIGCQLDRGCDLCNGLIWLAPLWEAGGVLVGDVVGSNALTVNASASWSGGFSQLGLTCNTTSANAGATLTLPASLRPSFPITVAVGVRLLGTPGSNSPRLAGLMYNNGNGSPYLCAGMY
jgi:hypothetical protein